MPFIINPYYVEAGGGAVTPIDFNPLRWYDAGSYALSDGASITVANPWVDQSANLGNATTTAGFEPIFKTNIFGSLPAVRMSAPDHLAFDGGDLALPASFTIFCIHKTSSDSIWMSRAGINRQLRITRAGANVYSYFGGGEVISGTLATAATAIKLGVWRRNDGTMNLDFFENATNFVGGASLPVIAYNQIGLIDGGPLNIDIGEVVIYNTFISDVDIQALYDDYFKPKFALP